MIGALKRFACEKCCGEYLVELDHDDLLAPDALRKLSTAITDNDNPQFLFSDFVEFRPDWSSRTYKETHGWETYDTQIFNKDLKAMRAFSPSAATLHKIFFAPNHVRVWQRDFYLKIGGHNPDMSICDDQDLIIRTYLQGGKFVHIPETLYLYRLQEGGGNTFLERNKAIQEKQQQVGNQYFYQLVAEECRRNLLPMIDLGAVMGLLKTIHQSTFREATSVAISGKACRSLTTPSVAFVRMISWNIFHIA